MTKLLVNLETQFVLVQRAARVDSHAITLQALLPLATMLVLVPGVALICPLEV